MGYDKNGNMTGRQTSSIGGPVGDNTALNQMVGYQIIWFEGNSVIYNHSMPRASTDKYYLGLEQSQVYSGGQITMSDIETTINNGGPIAVLYGNYDKNNIWSWHWVEGIGYVSAPGHESLVVSNDLWGGVQRIQTFDEFAGEYVGDNTPMETLG